MTPFPNPVTLPAHMPPPTGLLDADLVDLMRGDW